MVGALRGRKPEDRSNRGLRSEKVSLEFGGASRLVSSGLVSQLRSTPRRQWQTVQGTPAVMPYRVIGCSNGRASLVHVLPAILSLVCARTCSAMTLGDIVAQSLISYRTDLNKAQNCHSRWCDIVLKHILLSRQDPDGVCVSRSSCTFCIQRLVRSCWLVVTNGLGRTTVTLTCTLPPGRTPSFIVFRESR